MSDVSSRYAAVDVFYPSAGGAVAAVVIASDPAFRVVVEEHAVHLAQVENYQPGLLFARERPAISAVLRDLDPIHLLVVDGYVDLDPQGRPGARSPRSHPVRGAGDRCRQDRLPRCHPRRQAQPKPLA